MIKAGAHNVRRARAFSENFARTTLGDVAGLARFPRNGTQMNALPEQGSGNSGSVTPGVSCQRAVFVFCPSVRAPVAIAARATRAPLCVAPDRLRGVFLAELKVRPKSPPVREQPFFFSLCAFIFVYCCSLVYTDKQAVCSLDRLYSS